MKKIVCISLCVLLLVPLLAISAFADDVSVFSVTFVNNKSSSVYYNVYNSSNVSVADSGGGLANRTTVSLPCDEILRLHPDSDYGFNTVTVKVDNVQFTTLSTNSASPTVIDLTDVSSLTFEFSGGSVNTNFYFTLASPVIPPDPFAPVNDGVSSSINFAGQVLHFISTNADILALVGLAVALGFAIPYGVSKIKDLIKGY